MDYRELNEELKKIILPALEQEDAELIELIFIHTKGRPILKLLVDKRGGGINLAECARLNQRIGELLDIQDIMPNGYILEVSSPGLDRPLKTKSDFIRCINKKTKFFLSESIKDKIELDGRIIKVEGDSVYIDMGQDIIEIPLFKINKAKQIFD